jgi:hypothetical protein
MFKTKVDRILPLERNRIFRQIADLFSWFGPVKPKSIII